MSSVAVQLREASAADSGFIFDVRRQAFREVIDLDGGWDEAAELARHVERMGRQRFRVTVADGSDAGYIATAVYPVATASYPVGLYLHQLMVLPSFQSRGLGSACLRLLACEASALGLPLQLRVLRVNSRALAFYLAAGCEVVGESGSHVALQLRA